MQRSALAASPAAQTVALAYRQRAWVGRNQWLQLQLRARAGLLRLPLQALAAQRLRPQLRQASLGATAVVEQEPSGAPRASQPTPQSKP